MTLDHIRKTLETEGIDHIVDEHGFAHLIVNILVHEMGDDSGKVYVRINGRRVIAPLDDLIRFIKG